jgi:hypothetical protein
VRWKGKRRAERSVTAVVALSAVMVALTAFASISYAAPPRRGALRVQVAGLPPGQPGLAIL